MTDFAARRVMMVDTQVRPSDVTKFPIISAMLTIPREAFVPTQFRETAYVGEPIALGGGRVMLDARVLAKLLDALNILPTEMVLDIGCGLGYSAAVISRLADAVVAVETDPMAGDAQTRLLAQSIDNVAVIAGPLAQGCAKHGPYDVVIIQGGVEMISPEIQKQIKDGGRIAAVFMDGPLGVAKIGYKSGKEMSWRSVFDASLPVLADFVVKKDFAL